jgi:glycosyltransferase involved in cell wall biosynthesis
VTTRRPLRIGITCYPLVGGSGILATALGTELARRGHDVHFFSSAKPVRLDITQPRIFFHQVVVNEYRLFKYPDYTLPLAVKMAHIAREHQLDIFHVHYACRMPPPPTLRCRCSAAVHRLSRRRSLRRCTALTRRCSGRTRATAKRSSTHCRSRMQSRRLRKLARRNAGHFPLSHTIDVIPNFFIPSQNIRAREEVRRELGVGAEEFLIVHASNVRPLKRIDLLLSAFSAMRTERPKRLLILAGDTLASTSIWSTRSGSGTGSSCAKTW